MLGSTGFSHDAWARQTAWDDTDTAKTGCCDNGNRLRLRIYSNINVPLGVNERSLFILLFSLRRVGSQAWTWLLLWNMNAQGVAYAPQQMPPNPAFYGAQNK